MRERCVVVVRFKRLAVFFGGACLLLVILVLFIPKPELLQKVPFSTVFYDKDGRLLRVTLADDDRFRVYTDLYDIAPSMIEATLLYEDRFFYQHWGVNPWALMRAFWQTYVVGGRRVGASTITMQVARLRFGLDSHRLGGKFLQILRALQLERHYSKREILTAYFNLASYGFNIEGVGAASLIYFDKLPDELSSVESLTLSVVPQNPNQRNPALFDSLDELTKAKVALFERWRDESKTLELSEGQIRLPLNVRHPRDLPFFAPHFVSAQPLSQDVGVVKTTLNLPLQALLERQVRRYVDRRKAVGIDNAAVLLVNFKTMGVEAEIGSANFFDDVLLGQVNGARAKRSPGSALKPLIYGLAFDQGLIHAQSLLKDLPKRYGGYTPENYDQKFMGPLSAEQALVLSRNVPAVDLMNRLKSPTLYDLLQQVDLTDLRDEAHYGLALALGGFEVTMYELVELYAMLANGGDFYRTRQSMDAPLALLHKNVLSKEAAFLTLKVLGENPVLGGVRSLNTEQTPLMVSWKTGTSYAFRDAWAVGVFGPYVLAVWVGDFEGESNASFVGRTAAGPLFFDIVQSVRQLGDVRDEVVQTPDLNVGQVDVCAATGDLPNQDCPAVKKAWFIFDKSPIRVSDVHRRIWVNKKTGQRQCVFDAKTSVEKVYEFWPSDIDGLFQKAGIHKKKPPRFEDGCGLAVRSNIGRVPEIESLSQTVSYVKRHGSERQEMQFLATVDAGVKTLYWFLEQRFLGQTQKVHALDWVMQPGVYHLSVVDDHGRASRRYRFEVVVE